MKNKNIALNMNPAIRNITKNIQGGKDMKLDPATFNSRPAIKGINIIRITVMSALSTVKIIIIVNNITVVSITGLPNTL